MAVTKSQTGTGDYHIRVDTDGARLVLQNLKWPASDGTAGQVIATDGNGDLSFVDQTGGGGTSEDLVDGLGNLILDGIPTGSAGNYLTVANALSGNTPVISTDGVSDANVPLTITNKGNSDINITAGGNFIFDGGSGLVGTTTSSMSIGGQTLTMANGSGGVINASLGDLTLQRGGADKITIGTSTIDLHDIDIKDAGTIWFGNTGASAAFTEVAGGITLVDSSVQNMLVLSKATSAVNYIEMTNAATGVAPQIEAAGDDANIDLSLIAKGTGNVSLSGLLYPNTDGTANQVLVTDGAGNLTFDDPTFNIEDLKDAGGFFIIDGETQGGGANGNYLNVKASSAAGFGPEIIAAGSATNIDLNIDAKGTGNIILSGLEYPNADGVNGQVLTTNGAGVVSFQPVPAGPTLYTENYTGGTAPSATGSNAVAIGLSATSTNTNSYSFGFGASSTGAAALAAGGTSTLAQGNGSTAVGGQSNSATGQESVAIGGQTNTTSGFVSVAIGGSSCIPAAQYSVTISAGTSNIASGADYSAIIGGQNNEILSTADGSLVHGYYGEARLEGQYVHGSSGGQGDGDHQFVRSVVQGESAPGTLYVTLRTGSIGNTNITMPDYSTWYGKARIVGRDEDSTADISAAYEIEFVAGMRNSILTIHSNVKTVIYEHASATNWDAQLLASGGALSFQARGDTGQTVEWSGTIEATQVKVPAP